MRRRRSWRSRCCPAPQSAALAEVRSCRPEVRGLRSAPRSALSLRELSGLRVPRPLLLLSSLSPERSSSSETYSSPAAAPSLGRGSAPPTPARGGNSACRKQLRRKFGLLLPSPRRWRYHPEIARQHLFGRVSKGGNLETVTPLEAAQSGLSGGNVAVLLHPRQLGSAKRPRRGRYRHCPGRQFGLEHDLACAAPLRSRGRGRSSAGCPRLQH